ncbi:MAG TPA: ABC transporter permease [Methylophilaceae bacterium]
MKRILNLAGNRVFQGAVLPILLLVLWELASRQGVAYAYAFVPLGQIWQGLLELLQTGELVTNLTATLRTMLVGLLIGGTLGLAVGGMMGIFRIVDLLIGPLYHTIRQVPLLGLIPLIGLWFGNGDFSKVLIVSMAAFYPMVLNTYEGVRNVEKRYIEVATVLRFSRWQLFRRVLFPGALPSIWTGLMHALAFAWISTVGSELLFAAGPGLGGMMQNAQSISRMDIVVIGVASIGVTGLLLNAGFSRLRRYSLRWRETG